MCYNGLSPSRTVPRKSSTSSELHLELPLDRPAHALREVVNVVPVQARHRDAPVRGHVDVRPLRQRLRLRLRQARKAATTTPSALFHNHTSSMFSIRT